MADYFVDSTTGSDLNNGTTMDLAWATIQYALQSGGLTAGDIIWVRKLHSETPVADIAPIYEGTPAAPIQIIGWPRNTHAVSSSDWTNGSTSVTIDDNDMDREKHCGRYITAPDGEVYLITRVTATSTIIIDREYAGSTVTNQAATISADSDYTLAQAINDSGWTINKAAWNADADDLPLLDFNNTAFQLILSSDGYHFFKNMEMKDSTDSNGILRFDSLSLAGYIEGLLLLQSPDSTALYINNSCVIGERIIIEGDGAGTLQRGIYLQTGALRLFNSAIYNMGDIGMRIGGNAVLSNVNMGVEVANGDADIELYYGGVVSGKDVKFGGTNGYIDYFGASSCNQMSIENYQKVLGDNRTFFVGGYFEKVPVAGETPNKKLSDNVLKITPSSSGQEFVKELAYSFFEYIIDTDTTSRNYKFWIYNDSGVTLNATTAMDDIWLEAEYVKSYNDTSEYTNMKEYSTETSILDAADADDWDSLNVTAIAPAVSSQVRLRIYWSKYLAATNVFIDPEVVIS